MKVAEALRIRADIELDIGLRLKVLQMTGDYALLIDGKNADKHNLNKLMYAAAKNNLAIKRAYGSYIICDPTFDTIEC